MFVDDDVPVRSGVPSQSIEWDLHDLIPLILQLDVDELLILRSTIDNRLPATALKDMNLEGELVIQYQVAKALQTATLSSHEEANKKAQTVNTCAAALQQLVKMQSELHNAERFKAIESRLIQSLEKVPENYLHDFFEFYENEKTND